jgi:hypothetical protein
MNTIIKSEIEETLKSNFEFEFSLDFQGQVEYIESEDTDRFLEYERVLLVLVDKGIVPINERTEGTIQNQNGIIYTSYRTCTQVGEDWYDDNWEENDREDLVINVLN